jgi:hypothetical protein
VRRRGDEDEGRRGDELRGEGMYSIVQWSRVHCSTERTLPQGCH